jgi:hypothetical protein
MLSKEYETKQTPSDTSVYVLNCLFRSITSTDNGGALCCSSSVTHLFVASSSFFSCNSSNHGGAVYFYNSGCIQYILLDVCGYDCCSTNGGYGQFSYNGLGDSTSNKNYINYSSISHCGTGNSQNYMICHHRGTHYCPSVNISMNKCSSHSGFYFYPSVDSNYETCSLTYSTFADNIATEYTCIQINRAGAKYEIKSCNILRNTQGSPGTQGTIYTTGNLMIQDSCILENTATYVFRTSSSSYSITLSNCTVDSTSSNGYLTIKNTVTKSFILALNHMSTRYCNAEYDFAGYLTPITPPPSSLKKQIHCYTFGRYFNQPQLSDVVSLASILIFNFIHPYAHGDPFY